MRARLVAPLIAASFVRQAHAQDALPASSPPAQPSSAPTERDQELERQRRVIAELERSVRSLEQHERSPLLRFSGYVQVDWLIHSQASSNELDYSSNLPLNQDRFTLRRGHLRVDAKQGYSSAALEIDANTLNGPQLRPIDAELSLRYPENAQASDPEVALTLGLMKIPFGFEVPELDSVRPFLERASVLRALFPGEFDLGARVQARYQVVNLALAVMNGNPLGARTFPALAPVSAKDLVGRLGTRAEITPEVVLECGVSAETGKGLEPGTPTTKDQLVWRDENGDGIVQATEVQVIPGSSATPSSEFARFALGADARLLVAIPVLGGLAVRVELIRAQNLDRGLEPAAPIATGYDLRELGWYVGATQELTKCAEIGARYDRYNPNQNALERRAENLVPYDRSYSTLALMAMARYENARLLLEYDVNGNALGRAASGAPTTLRSNALTLRGQVVF
ncbi:MAG TPA: hypothetical protein VGI10_24345 [Polyangiaceae bacterium]|jgi:hypothetical protein